MTNKMSTNEIIKALDLFIGNTEPTGESERDRQIIDNLRTLIDITNWCLDGVMRSAYVRHSLESSIRIIGETAFSAMCEWEEWLRLQNVDCETANHDAGGCLGYGRGKNDDEPIDVCRNCSRYTGYCEGGET